MSEGGICTRDSTTGATPAQVVDDGCVTFDNAINV